MNIVEISTGVGCSPSCSFCPQKVHVTNYAAKSSEFKMSMETFEQCLANIPSNVEIQFAGYAEPWLNQHATDMLLRAHATSHRVSVFTTCVGMTVADVERFRHLPFHHFCLHLPDDKGQMRVSVTPEYLATVQACLAIPAVSLMVVGHLHPEVQKALKRPVKDWTQALISRAGTVENFQAPYKAGKLRKQDCMYHSVLLPNGDAHLCCCDYGLKHRLGSVKEVSYRELFKSDAFQKILAALEDESQPLICRNCELAVCEK